MANVKITGLPALTTPATADLLEIVDDVAGTPTSKKITIADLLKSPGPIGGTAPGTGAFTTLTASSFINGAYATVASHATTSAIWAAAGNVINFTGTETITDFPAAAQAGSQRFLICAGAVIFTHAGNITVQGAATYTASAGDVVLVTAITTTTFKINILPQDGKAIIPVVQQNLLTNSGFEIWSNSTLLEATSGAAPVTSGDNADFTAGNTLVTNGGFDSATTGWSPTDATLASIASGESGNCLEMTRTGGAGQNADMTATTVVIGKLYKFTVYVKSGTSGDEAFSVIVYNVSYAVDATISGTTTGAWVAHTVIFEASSVTTRVTLAKGTATAGTMLFDSVTLYEVTPGCIAADTKGPDGWNKPAGMDAYRQHNDATYTKDGSFYSLKCSPTAQYDNVSWPSQGTTNLEWLAKFSGKTVTFGAWVWSDTANDVRVQIADGVATTTGGIHTGSSTWEWLEATKTVSTSLTTFNILVTNVSAAVPDFYISQPTLIFGDHIGEGNYSRPPGEIIWFEKAVASNLLNAKTGASGWSTVAVTTLNLEADSNGAIGKGVKGIMVMSAVSDSASAAGDLSIYLRSAAGQSIGYINSVGGLTNNANHYLQGIQACNSDGDAQYAITASGANTFDTTLFKYLGIQTR